MPISAYSGINYPLVVSLGHTYADTLMAYGGEAYFKSLSVSGTTPSIKNDGYTILWNGLRTLDLDTGIVKKVLYFGDTPASPNTEADKANWTELEETNRIVVVNNISDTNVTTIGTTNLVVPANFLNDAAFSEARDHGKIFLLNAQTTFSQNGFYIAKFINVGSMKLIRMTEYGSTGSTDTFAKTLVYCTANGHFYRFKPNGTETDVYELDDYINNGVLSRSGTAITLTGTLAVTSNATVGGTLGVTGVSTLAAVNCNAIGATQLSTTGLVTVGTTLGVTGATTLSSTLGVTGAATFSSTIGATGSITTAAALISSYTGVGGAIQVNTNKFTVQGSNGNTSIAGTLGVIGATTIAGNVLLGGALNVTGATILGSTLSAGNTTITGTLSTTGTATFGGFSKTGNYVIPLAGSASADLSLVNGNVQYVHVTGRDAVINISLTQDQSNILNYLGGTFLFTVINASGGNITVRFYDDMFVGVTSASYYTVANGAGISYTGVILGNTGTTSTYYLYGTLAPAYQNLMV